MFTDKEIFLIDDRSFKKFTDQIKKQYSLKRLTPEDKNLILHDTFDWRLLNSGSALVSSSSRYFLFSEKNEVTELRSRKKFNFASDFPESDLKNIIREITGVRKLYRSYKLKQSLIKYEILDSEGKIICRFELYFFRIGVKEKEIIGFMKVFPLKGYSSEYTHLLNLLELSEIKLSNRSPLEIILSQFDDMDKTVDKTGYGILPEMPAWMAMKKIYSFLLDTIKANEDGLLRNIDAEFLHDFRVAVRRTRSALSIIRKVIPADENSHFQKEFKFIQSATNHARDLDVDIENKQNYKSILPVEMHAGIDFLTEYLEKERSREQKKLIRLLNSERYKFALKEWESSLSRLQPSMEDFGKSFILIKQLSSKIIMETFEKTLKTGDKIKTGSPDEDFHKFRILLKRLRYLFEFFSNLYSEENIKPILKQLRIMQDNLGEFNDLCIQMEKLSGYIKDLKINDENLRDVIASVGGLIAVKAERKMKVREDFFKLYSGYANEKNRQSFKKVFKKGTN